MTEAVLLPFSKNKTFEVNLRNEFGNTINNKARWTLYHRIICTIPKPFKQANIFTVTNYR